MKNITVWIISAISGLILVLLLNTTPLAKLGFGIVLPIGWQNAQVDRFRDCDFNEGPLVDETKCTGACDDVNRHNEGSPFVYSRLNKTNSCFSDKNYLAMPLNALAGVLLGLLFTLFLEKRWHHTASK